MALTNVRFYDIVIFVAVLNEYSWSKIFPQIPNVRLALKKTLQASKLFYYENSPNNFIIFREITLSEETFDY